MGVRIGWATSAAVVAVLVVLAGCSAGGSDSQPRQHSTSPSSTVSAATEPTAEGSPVQTGNAAHTPKSSQQIEWVRQIRNELVLIRLPCGPKERVHIGLDMDMGWPSLRELALALTKTRGTTALVVLYSTGDAAVIVPRDDADNPLARIPVHRVDSRWFAGAYTRCDG
jgi:hypothetical protein